MLFRLESEAHEQERLQAESHGAAATQNTAPMTEERTSEPVATTHTTEAQHEGTVLATTNPTPEQQVEKTTLLEPRPTRVTQLEASDIPNTAETHPSPTPPQPPVTGSTNEPVVEGLPRDQLEQTQAPEDILGILEED